MFPTGSNAISSLAVLLFGSLLVTSRLTFGVHAAALSESYGSDGTAENLDDVVYDQRQNGSENLRIHMNDVTLVIAPSEGILQLMGASAADILTNNNEISSGSLGKPTSVPSTYSQSDCAVDPVAKCKQQPHKKNRLRLSSLIVPLLNRATGNK